MVTQIDINMVTQIDKLIEWLVNLKCNLIVGVFIPTPKEERFKR